LLSPKEERVEAFDRVAELTAYQNAAYAAEYSAFVADVARRAPALAPVVARNLYKLMAYKDEYEVARLLTKPSFENQIRDSWSQVESFSYNLHPPMFRRFFKKKIAFGPWFRTPLKMLAAMKGLRGGPLDIFGRSKHRRMERQLIAWYREGADVQARLPLLSTYLGHVNVSATSVYLTMTAELLGEASIRFERYARPPEEVAHA